MASQPFVLVTEMSETGATMGMGMTLPVQDVDAAAQLAPMQTGRPRPTQGSTARAPSPAAMPARHVRSRPRLSRANLAGLLVGPIIAVGLMAGLSLDLPQSLLGSQLDDTATSSAQPEPVAHPQNEFADPSTRAASAPAGGTGQLAAGNRQQCAGQAASAARPMRSSP